jgi:membrane protease YdiL (CAAX protease family)
LEKELKPSWQRLFHFDWKFGLFLIGIICIPRFLLVLNANASGSYGAIGLIMVISAMAPFIFLGKYGRRKAGLTKPTNHWSLVPAFATGLVFSILLYLLAQLLYGSSFENWYKYIGRSYNIPAGITGDDKAILFTIVATTGMIFSPVGEELFFRGIVHAAFAKSMGERNASVVDASAFAVIHISHFGLVFINDRWDFLPIPALIWILSMFLVSVLFFLFKKRAGSILGAIVCHAAFNLGMTYCIFYLP